MLVVRNEPSTGATSGIAELRRLMNRPGHSALTMAAL
jgi:hypothetical protein